MKIVKKNWKMMMFLLLTGMMGYACSDSKDGTKKNEADKGKTTTPARTAQKIYVWARKGAVEGDLGGGMSTRAKIDEMCSKANKADQAKPDKITSAKFVTKTLILTARAEDKTESFPKLSVLAGTGGAKGLNDPVYGLSADDKEKKISDSYTKFITNEWAVTLKDAGLDPDGDTSDDEYWIGATENHDGADEKKKAGTAGTAGATNFHCKNWTSKLTTSPDEFEGSFLTAVIKSVDADGSAGSDKDLGKASPLKISSDSQTQNCDQEANLLCISFPKN